MTLNLQRRGAWTFTLLVCLSVSLFCLLYPIYVIRPFRTQGAQELSVALAVMYFRPLVTLFSAALAMLAAALYWQRQPVLWRRLLMATGAVALCGLAVLTRVNLFEQMFHPIERPAFVAASEMKLDGDEKVLAIRIGESARAYPVRSMAYHHLVNDTVESRAVVATY